MNVHKQKLELIQWINNINDYATLQKIKEIKNANHNAQDLWWNESTKKDAPHDTGSDDNLYKHIF